MYKPAKDVKAFIVEKMFTGFMNVLKVEWVRVADQGDVTLAKKWTKGESSPGVSQGDSASFHFLFQNE